MHATIFFRGEETGIGANVQSCVLPVDKTVAVMIWYYYYYYGHLYSAISQGPQMRVIAAFRWTHDFPHGDSMPYRGNSRLRMKMSFCACTVIKAVLFCQLNVGAYAEMSHCYARTDRNVIEITWFCLTLSAYHGSLGFNQSWQLGAYCGVL